MNLNRRQFLAASAMAPFAVASAGTARPLSVSDSITPQAHPFDLGSTRLVDGALIAYTEHNRGFLESLETDRLLHTFRLTAGLPTSAEPLGGWEKPAVELRGHFTGHFLSACSLMSVSEGNATLRGKGNLMVAELAKCQKANGNGYLSAFPPEFFDRLKAGKKVWAPWYTIHKILAGLLDMYVLAGNQQALDVACGMAGWTKRWTDTINDADMARILRVEFGGMNEVLDNLYAATGLKDYAEASRRFDDERLFGPLADGRDELKGLHVNTQIPKIIGAARRYELTGDARYRRIAEFFWTQVTQHRAYATGGTSNDEHWRSGPDQLAGELGPATQECCCTYNMLKLTRHLFSWSPEARYFDYYERALYNGIFGTMNPKNGLTMYYVPLATGYWKVFASPRGSFWCCTGTGVESFSKLADSIYFHDDKGVYVNLFVGSELDWEEKGVRLRQDGVPGRSEARLRVQTGKSLHFGVRIREPYWTDGKMEVFVNDKPAAAKREHGYWVIDRFWADGDEVRVSLPMDLHVHPMPDDDQLQAIMYGPLVLAGDLGHKGVNDETQQGGDNPPDMPVPDGMPDFVAAGANPRSWIAPVGRQPYVFQTKGQARDVVLAPLNRILDQRYGVYWRIKAKDA